MTDIKDKLKAMVQAKCSIKDCDKQQSMYMGLQSPINPNIQETFPFCFEHFMAILERKLKSFTLKNGYVYGKTSNKKRWKSKMKDEAKKQDKINYWQFYLEALTGENIE